MKNICELTISSWSSEKTQDQLHGISHISPYVWRWTDVSNDGPKRTASFCTALVSGSEAGNDPMYVLLHSHGLEPNSVVYTAIRYSKN